MLLPDVSWSGFSDDVPGHWIVTAISTDGRTDHRVPLGSAGGAVRIALPLVPAILQASYCRDDGICIESAGARFPDDLVSGGADDLPSASESAGQERLSAIGGGAGPHYPDADPAIELTWERGQLASLVGRAVRQGLPPDALNWRRATARVDDLRADIPGSTVFLDEIRFLSDLARDDVSIYSIRAADRETLDPPASALLGSIRPCSWGLQLADEPDETEVPVGRTRWASLTPAGWVPAELEVDDRGHWWLRPAN